MKEIIIAILGSGAFSAVISSIVSSISNRKKKKNSYDVALRLLLLDAIKRQGKEYLSAKKISDSDFRAFVDTYQTYKALGGDGYADKIMNEVNKLPISVEM